MCHAVRTAGDSLSDRSVVIFSLESGPRSRGRVVGTAD